MPMVVLIDRSDLHLRELQRVFVAIKSKPVDSFSFIRRVLMWTAEVETVEVGVMATFVPPSACEPLRTVQSSVNIILSVERRELLSILIRQRISYKLIDNSQSDT